MHILEQAWGETDLKLGQAAFCKMHAQGTPVKSGDVDQRGVEKHKVKVVQ